MFRLRCWTNRIYRALNPGDSIESGIQGHKVYPDDPVIMAHNCFEQPQLAFLTIVDGISG